MFFEGGTLVLRKLASIMAIVFAATLALAGTALAAPYDPATIAADRGPDGSYEIFGTGFGDTQPDLYVTASVLNSSGQLQTYRFSLDANGDFAGSVPGSKCSAVVTIVGYPSGETLTTTIAGENCSGNNNGNNNNGNNGGGNNNGGGGSNTGGGSSSGGSAGVNGAGYSSGGGSYNGGGYSTGNTVQGAYSPGLANTGASIAAPVAIGLGTLVLGLGLLFFGTRGVIRRRG